MSKYKKISNGEILRFPEEGSIFNLACCDCGLVHKMVVKNVTEGKDKGMIDMIMIRDNRRTGQIRRWNEYEKK